MPAIVLNNLAAATITYNGVQFGGADADYKSVPPTYKFKGRFVYDQSSRTITHVQYLLIVNAIFYESSEAALATNVENIRRKLSKVGKQLKIVGLGTNFETITQDPKWGPKPQSFDWQAIGQRAWELTWVVEFAVSECSSSQTGSWMSFNFETTWANDFEGNCTRTIAGHVDIASQRTGTEGKKPGVIADQHRNSINVVVPAGFRRLHNVWRENDDHTRLDFIITDEQEAGDALPQGIIRGSGSFTYESQGPGFSQAKVNLNLNLRVAPGFPPGLAGQIALIAAKTKQQEMITANGVTPGGGATVIPLGLRITNGKFSQARETSASFSWGMTRCVAHMMTAAGIWKPIIRDDPHHRLWQASVSNLWKNRGTAGLKSNLNDAVIIDLCDNTSTITIGAGGEAHSHQSNPQFTFNCPDIPEDGGWLGHDLRISIRRLDHSTVHRKAIPYLPSFLQAPVKNALRGVKIPLWGSVFDTSQTGGGEDTLDRRHDIEYHGNPEIFVLLQFRGLRLMRQPQVPEIKTIAGVPVIAHSVEGLVPRLAYDSPCPVWFVNGWRLYRVNGYVPDILATESNVSCAASNGNNQQY